MKTKFFFLGIVLLLWGISFTFAQEGQKGAVKEHKGAWAQDLQLTAEQKQTMLEQKARIRKAMAEIKGQLRVKRVELENELEKPDPNAGRLEQLVEEISGLQKRKMMLRIQAALEMKKILTPEQLEKLKQHRMEHRAKRRDRWGFSDEEDDTDF